MAQQNGGLFDPVLLGDYRDSPEGISSFNGSFFNEALPSQDFNTPYNTGSPESHRSRPLENDLGLSTYTSKSSPPNGLAAQKVDASAQALTYKEAWYVRCIRESTVANVLDRERFQSTHGTPTGEHDINELCSDFKAKAQCSMYSGTVVDPKDMDKIMRSDTADAQDPFKMFS